MKKLLATLTILILSLTCLCALDFSQTDKGFDNRQEWESTLEILKQMLPEAENNHERSECLWRMSLFSCYLGSAQTTTTEKRNLDKKHK